MQLKRSMLIFLGLYCAFLVLIFHHGCMRGRQQAVPEAAVRELLTWEIRQENQRIEQSLLLLEMLERGDVASAKKRLQELLYISIMQTPEWGATDEPESLEGERLQLLRRIKAYHEKHRHEIDMTLPSNRAAVRQLERVK